MHTAGKWKSQTFFLTLQIWFPGHTLKLAPNPHCLPHSSQRLLGINYVPGPQQILSTALGSSEEIIVRRGARHTAPSRPYLTESLPPPFGVAVFISISLWNRAQRSQQQTAVQTPVHPADTGAPHHPAAESDSPPQPVAVRSASDHCLLSSLGCLLS